MTAARITAHVADHCATRDSTAAFFFDAALGHRRSIGGQSIQRATRGGRGGWTLELSREEGPGSAEVRPALPRPVPRR